MRDFSEEVKTTLETVCTTYYFYPDSFNTLPVISYYDSENSSDDGRDLLTPIGFHIDVWAKTVPSLKSVVSDVDLKMRDMGFARTFSQPLPDPSGYRRQSMIYKGKYNALDGKIYSQL